MTKEEFQKCQAILSKKAASKRAEKEEEYFSAFDLAANFKGIAHLRRTTTPSVIMTLMSKQYQSISDMVNTIGLDTPYPQDVWDEKFVDLLNYLLKLYATIRCGE